MRRWNGWGDENTHYPLPPSAAGYLAERLGPGTLYPSASLEAVLAAIPPSPLPPHPLISTQPLDRLLHACGQSLPDWIALRSGRIPAFPAGVAFPTSDEQVRALIHYAHRQGIALIPYGGGTSVVGHINPPGGIPVLTVDLSRMGQMLSLDETSRLATFEAGVAGPVLEAQLKAAGYTLGHFPQSFELSTLGGCVAARSSGQQSYYYGRIEDLFAGGHMETPVGELELPPFPASAAGPDLRHLVLGSEGRFGILTHAIVRVRPLPQREAFYGVFFRDWQSGAAAVRAIAQAGVRLSMMRLSDAQETETTLALSGKDRLVALADRGLRALGYGGERSLLIYAVTGDRLAFKLARRQADEACRDHGGLPVGQIIGRQWRKTRFLTPYLRNTLWDYGYAIDTLETALPWSGVLETAIRIKDAIQRVAEERGERVLVFAHLSHVYRDGASIYVTYLFPLAVQLQEMGAAAGLEATLSSWQAMKAAASQVILASGGTISHQHGVGSDHAAYLPQEKGAVGMQVLQAIGRAFDPHGIMNPGKW